MTWRPPAPFPQYRDGDGFRWRGQQPTRTEALFDAAFGVGLALLVMASAVPDSPAELLALMLKVPAVALSFALLFYVWRAHYVFCRRFGMDDGLVQVLTAALVFVVLCYVYPLKFVMGVLDNFLLGVLGVEGDRVQFTIAQFRACFIVFLVGTALLHLMLGLFYALAWRRREGLALDVAESLATAQEAIGHTVVCFVCVGSGAVALLAPVEIAQFSLFGLFLTWPLIAVINGALARRLASPPAAAQASD